LPATELRPHAAWALADWLAYQESLHPKLIALGLERVREVALRLGVLPAACPTLTVAGTNGKGSSVTLAAEIYRAAGYRVGRYTSPHLLAYNERIAIDGRAASDAALCDAFEAVEAARATISLTYFEFGTLAALWLFRRERVDVQVLEVGLGGRLDAVNIVDADCALITNIGLDHLEWLGKDRESIGFEKAGILRGGRPAICAEPPTRSILECAERVDARLWAVQQDFGFTVAEDGGSWDWQGPGGTYRGLPRPGLAGQAQYANAAGVLAAVTALQERLPVAEAAVRSALPQLCLRGRYEKLGDVILDVAHNAEAAAVLAENLRADGLAASVHLVLGMLSDKPVEAVCALLAPLSRSLWFGTLPPPRGLTGEELRRRAAAIGIAGTAAGSIEEAFHCARASSLREPGQKSAIVVCGSFLSVAAIAGCLAR